jgi:methionine-rich copper-binding protein CopC
VAAALALAAWPLFAVAAPASAHARLVGADPAPGEVVAVVPASVRFELSEPLDPTAYVVVTGPDGSSVVEGDPEVDGTVVTQRLSGGGDGSYVMAVRAVSRDGHPVTGRVEFVVGEPTAGGADAPSPSVTAPPGATAAARDSGARDGPFGRPGWVTAVPLACLAGALGLWVVSRRAS